MPYHVRVKICGITSIADARMAVAQGADAIGLNFHPQSPRFLAPAESPAILRELPPFVEPVGIFVEQPLRDVFGVLNQLGRLRTFQWYGSNREVCDAYPFHYVPCFPVRDELGLAEVTRFLDLCHGLGRMPSAVLLDAAVAGKHGGTGQTLPWKLLADFRCRVPLILAGGLTPENVGEAVRTVRPYAVDVASGVESSPGRKDADKVRRFIDRAREAAARLP